MVKLKFFVVAFFIITNSAFGQVKTPETEEQPYIEVTGIAEKEVVPDEIYIQIVIREKYINKVKVSIEEQEEKLKNAIKSLNIDLSNLFLSDANADYVKISWQTKDVLTKKDYSLKVSDAKTVGLVFQELEKLEITDAFISKVSHSQIETLRKETKTMAIKAAKEKADYLLTAIGEQLGKPLIIKENDVLPLQNVANVNIRYEGKGYFSNNDVIQFQKIKLQASIYIKFSIK